MAKGDNARLGYQSSVGLAEETTFGTKVDSFDYLEFISESFKVDRESRKLESINTGRSFIKRVQLNETVEGSLEAEFNPASDFAIKLMKQAFGGTVTSATQASSDILHTINVGDMESNAGTSTSSDVKSLTFQADKGGTVYDYVGCRVNSFTLKAEVGGMVMMTAEVIGKSGSLSSSTPTAVFSDIIPADYLGVTFALGDSLGNVSAETVQSFEFSINNNLDGEQRGLGSRSRNIIPPVRREVSLKVTQRADTTTNYSQFLAETISAIKITMDTTQTITSSTGSETYQCQLEFPRCYTKGPAQPEVGDAGVLSYDIEYEPISDNTTTAYDVRALVYNATANYF